MTYSELKTHIEAWLHRDDLTPQMDTFILLFEARANNTIRAQEMEVLQAFTPTTEFQALPAGFLEFRNVQANLAHTKTLEYASPQKIAQMGLITGDPHYYTFNGNQVEFSPSASGQSMEWTYFQAIPALSGTNTSNWLLAKHPDYYLMGCVHQALVWAQDERAPQIESMLMTMESMINNMRNKAMSGPMTVSAI